VDGVTVLLLGALICAGVLMFGIMGIDRRLRRLEERLSHLESQQLAHETPPVLFTSSRDARSDTTQP
jgi:hypothetical protein